MGDRTMGDQTVARDDDDLIAAAISVLPKHVVWLASQGRHRDALLAYARHRVDGSKNAYLLALIGLASDDALLLPRGGRADA